MRGCLTRCIPYDIYVCHDIMRALSLYSVRRYVSVLARRARPKGCVYDPAWWVHVRACGPCVGKYHTFNLARVGK